MLLQAFLNWEISQGRSGSPCLLRGDAFEQRGEFGKGVIDTDPVVKTPAIVNEVAANLLVLLADLDQRQDLGGADDRRIHACLTAVMKENGVEDDPRRWG